MKSWLGVLLTIVTVTSTAKASGQLASPQTTAFLNRYCADCHADGADGADEGGFTLDSLNKSLDDPVDFEAWRIVHHRIKHREMPPPDMELPSDDEIVEALAPISNALIAAERSQQKGQGRVTARRLNAIQYETTLSDLLQSPLSIANLLPEDAKAEGFTTVGEALNISSVQMAAYLDAIDVAIDQSVRFTERPPTQRFRLSLLNNHGYMENYRLQHPALPVVDGMNLYATEAMSNHHALWGHYVVPRSGRYRITLSAYRVNTDDPIALTLRVGGNGHKESLREPHRLLSHLEIDSSEPRPYQWEGDLLRGHFLHVYPSELPIYRFQKNKRYSQVRWQGPGVCVQWLEIEGPLIESWPPPGEEILFGGVATEPVPGASNPDPNEQLNSPPIIPADPRERPADWPPGGNSWQLLAGVVNNRAKFPAQDYSRRRGQVIKQIFLGRHPKADPLPDYQAAPHYLPMGSPLPSYGGEPIYKNVPHPGPLNRTFQLAPIDPKADAERLIRRMLPRAFRRPVPDREADRYVDFVHSWLDQGVSFESAMRTGYKAIFTSPQFLFHQSSLTEPEPERTEPGQTESASVSLADGNASKNVAIDDFALAERLAYFLWCSTPDKELLSLAKQGRLSKPTVLRAQTERLLLDRRSQRFVKDFLGQWLDLHDIEFTTPDTHLFPEYDAVLHTSMLSESHAFFRHLLDHDLSVRNLMDSDFVMINRRMADHYGIDGVAGMEPTFVQLDDDSVRGGVMTQAAVLKVTANGSHTSPVVRGVWINERILGTPPPPPPPGIPAVEPDIRGATTIRQQLEKHRSNDACASCHAKIDPPGLALESFDPVGRFRTKYRVLDPTKADLKKQNHSLRYTEGLSVDPSFELADGRPFADVRELKHILSSDTNKIASTFMDRLLVYATGATSSFTDHSEIESIVNRLGNENLGVRSLVHAVVQSDLFRHR